jgi:hypothetical protein
MTFTFTDIADEIYEELGSPTDVSISSITYWLRNNVGKLNNLLGCSFSISESDYELTTSLDTQQKDIFKKIYLIYYYQRKISSNSTAMGYDSIIQLDRNGNKVRFANPNEVSKFYLSLKKDEEASLKTLINSYKFNNIKPVQVAGDDTIESDISTRRLVERVRDWD